MRVLHLLSQRPDSTGSGVTLQALLREGAASGEEGFLVAGLDGGGWPADLPLGPESRLAVEFPGPGREHALPGMSDEMPYPSARFRDLGEAQLDAYEAAFAAALREAADRFRPDLVHAHHLWIAAAVARRALPETPLVVSCHGSDLRQWRTCERLRRRAAGAAGADRVLALSEAQRVEIADLHGLRPERIAVVGAGYRDGLFRPLEKPAPDPVRVVYAGKLSRAKGVPWLLRALAEIESPAWRLDLVGGGAGAEHEECLRLAAGLGERVRVHGAVPQERLADRLGRAHVFALPSFFEGLPLVLIEALACGCRALTTDLPGARELLGAAGGGAVDFVPLPRLRHADQPFEEDEPAFVAALAAALRRQFAAAVAGVPATSPELSARLAASTWAGVHERVRAVRDGALQARRDGGGA